MGNQCGIIVALTGEARTLVRSSFVKQSPIFYNARHQVYVSGMGAEQAKAAAETLIARGCDHLISWGCCAGIHTDMNSGDVVMPAYMVHQQQRIECQPLSYPPDTLKQLRVQHKPMTHTEQFLNTPQQKQSLYKRSEAIAADMESFIILKTAQQHGKHCSVIRAVSDTVDTTLPENLHRHINAYGEPNIFGFMQMIIQQPIALKQLLTLSKGFQQATHALKLLAPLILAENTTR